MSRPFPLGALAVLLSLVTACSSGAAPAGGATPRPSRPTAASSAPAPVRSFAVRSFAVRHRGSDAAIEGFASRTSVRSGEAVDLYVSTLAPSYRVQAFRIGGEGGTLGELVWTSPTQVGRRQTRTRTLAATGTVSAAWAPSLRLQTRGFPPGDYLLRLEASTGAGRFVPLTIRFGSARGRVVLVNAVTTWQAYNGWGGATLYRGPGGGFADRARAVSFDRPYDGYGAGQFFSRELPVVTLAERLGLPLEYVTDVDLDADPHLLDGARAVITLGHDEYWSVRMRAAVVRALGAGTNIAFLGANAVFRRIRLAPSAVGPDRVEIDYKVAREDPLFSTGSQDVTADWDSPPRPVPPDTLTGLHYDCFPAHADMVVAAPHSWLFAGTGVTGGQHLHLAVGIESDRFQLGSGGPTRAEIITHSPLRCGGRASWSDSVYYVAPSGAGVFSTGSIAWVCVMASHCQVYGDPTARRVLTGVTSNLLRAFAVGPAGRAHPVQDNVRAVLG